MRKWSRFSMLSVLFVATLPLGGVAGPVLTFQPRVNGSVGSIPQASYSLADGGHLDIEWQIGANSPVTLIANPVQANPPIRVGDGDVNLNFSKLSVLDNPTFPYFLNPAGPPLKVIERAETDGQGSRGRYQRWRLGVTATYSPGVPEDSFLSSGASVIVKIYNPVYAVDIVGGTTGTTVNASTLGWQFTISKPTHIGALGFWDEGPAGIGSHTVALWNAAGGGPLASLTVDASNDVFASTQSTGNWIFAMLPSAVVIDPGTYVIGATYAANDPDPFRISSLPNPLTLTTTANGLTFNGSRSTSGPVLPGPSPEFPDFYVPGELGYFGPNFIIDPVPEPSSVALAVIGGLAIALRAFRRRR